MQRAVGWERRSARDVEVADSVVSQVLVDDALRAHVAGAQKVATAATEAPSDDAGAERGQALPQALAHLTQASLHVVRIRRVGDARARQPKPVALRRQLDEPILARCVLQADVHDRRPIETLRKIASQLTSPPALCQRLDDALPQEETRIEGNDHGRRSFGAPRSVRPGIGDAAVPRIGLGVVDGPIELDVQYHVRMAAEPTAHGRAVQSRAQEESGVLYAVRRGDYPARSYFAPGPVGADALDHGHAIA